MGVRLRVRSSLLQPTSLAALLCSHCPFLCVHHAAVELMTCALLLCVFCPGFRAAALLLAVQQLFTGVKCRVLVLDSFAHTHHPDTP